MTAAADAGAMSVRLGDCICNVADLGGQVETVPVAPCSDPHQGEVYAEKALTDNKLPDDIEGVADEFCMGEILDFLGGDPAEKYPDLSVMYLHPTAAVLAAGRQAGAVHRLQRGRRPDRFAEGRGRVLTRTVGLL
ncbi:MAG: hypothetical protein QM804_15160 [Propionicimonas sp.]